jgi:hypothetical protein
MKERGLVQKGHKYLPLTVFSSHWASASAGGCSRINTQTDTTYENLDTLIYNEIKRKNISLSFLMETKGWGASLVGREGRG